MGIEGYVNRILRTNFPTIIVEGTDDIYFIETLIEEFQLKRDDFRIDSSEYFRTHEKATMTNRQRIKKCCNLLKKKDMHYNVCGLIDREYDGFSVENGEIVDKVGNHKIENDCIFYTRGHSIENYIFNKMVLIKLLRIHIKGEKKEKVISYLNNNESTIISLISKISEISKYLNENYKIKYKKIYSSITKKLFSISKNDITLDYENWGIAISERSQKLSLKKFKKLMVNLDKIFESRKYPKYWFVHGHLGFTCIWIILDSIACYYNCTLGDNKLRKKTSFEVWASSYYSPNEEKPEYPEALISKIKSFTND